MKMQIIKGRQTSEGCQKSKPMLSIGPPVVVNKPWGKEVIIANNDNYCGKVLKVDKGKSLSMHYHRLKTETWYVAFGLFRLEYIDTNTAEWLKEEIGIGSTVHIPASQPHRLECIEEGAIFEVSTEHFDSDSYRIKKYE